MKLLRYEVNSSRRVTLVIQTGKFLKQEKTVDCIKIYGKDNTPIWVDDKTGEVLNFRDKYMVFIKIALFKTHKEEV